MEELFGILVKFSGIFIHLKKVVWGGYRCLTVHVRWCGSSSQAYTLDVVNYCDLHFPSFAVTMVIPR
jgi:hypothetical protein